MKQDITGMCLGKRPHLFCNRWAWIPLNGCEFQPILVFRRLAIWKCFADFINRSIEGSNVKNTNNWLREAFSMLLTLTLNSNNCIFSYFPFDFPYSCSDNTFIILFCLMYEAPYSMLCELQVWASLIECHRKCLPPVELNTDGQGHRTRQFYNSL